MLLCFVHLLVAEKVFLSLPISTKMRNGFFFLHLYMSTVHLFEQAAAAASSLCSQQPHASLGQCCVLQVPAPGHSSVLCRAPCKGMPSTRPPACLGCNVCKISMPIPLSCSHSPAALASCTLLRAGRPILTPQPEHFNKHHCDGMHIQHLAFILKFEGVMVCLLQRKPSMSDGRLFSSLDFPLTLTAPLPFLSQAACEPALALQRKPKAAVLHCGPQLCQMGAGGTPC